MMSGSNREVNFLSRLSLDTFMVEICLPSKPTQECLGCVGYFQG